MKILIAGLFLLGALVSSRANADSGIVYEVGGGVGYILQMQSLQVKALGSYFRDSKHPYNDAAAFKLSAVQDLADIEEVKLYAGLGFWDSFVTDHFSSYQDRFDGILGLRYRVGSHVQVDVFTSLISYLTGETVFTHAASNGFQYTTVGQTGWSFARSGAVAVSYLF